MKQPSWWLCLLAYFNYGNARRRLGAIYGWNTRKSKTKGTLHGVVTPNGAPHELSVEREVAKP